MTPQTVAHDRTLTVPRGHVVATRWVDIHRVRFANRTRMAVGDVAAKYQQVLARGDCGGWPPPVGCWDGETFVISDGRHEYVAALMLGHDRILVAWVEREKGE